MEQLSLDLFPHKKPTWEDVAKRRARVVEIEPYSHSCERSNCLWKNSMYKRRSVDYCYLFKKPILNGMCPCTVELVWKV